jgi:hypothetical protein
MLLRVWGELCMHIRVPLMRASSAQQGRKLKATRYSIRHITKHWPVSAMIMRRRQEHTVLVSMGERRWVHVVNKRRWYCY